MCKLFTILIVVLASSVALADGVAFRYVASNGTLSFTDDEERIPAKHREAAEKVMLGEYDRFTVIATAPKPIATETIPTVVVQPIPDCGAIRVRSERRDVKGGVGGDGHFNTRFYIIEDDCGVLFDASYYPYLNAFRR